MIAVLEILDRLRVNYAERNRLADEEASLWSMLQTLQSGKVAPVPLVFDPDRQTIRWDGGSVHLGWKPCRIVKALYFAKKRRLLITTLEARAWGKNGNPKSNTVRQTLFRLKNALQAEHFPYEIVSVYCKAQNIETKNRITGATYQFSQPAISGYKLVPTLAYRLGGATMEGSAATVAGAFG